MPEPFSASPDLQKPMEHGRHPLRHPLTLLALTALLVLAGGGVYWLRLPTVFLTVGGVSRRAPERGLKTVGDLLQREKVILKGEDFCTPPLATRLIRDMAIKVTRVAHRREEAIQKTLPRAQWTIRTRQNLRRVLIERGEWAETHQTIDRKLYDGVEVSQKILKVAVKKHPFYTLTLFDAKGQPAKTFDLLKTRKMTMLATAYYVGDPMVPSDTTFLGHKLQRGLVAVDPRVIPLRTRLYIPTYGYAYADDTGSAIKRRRIDLAVKDKYEEAKYNHRQVTVYLLEKNANW